MNTWMFLMTVIFFGIWASVSMAAPMAQVTVRVVDEQGQAIEGAQVSIAFVVPVLKPEGTGLGAITDLLEGLSDAAGYFTGTVETDEEIISLNAAQDGYYDSTDGVPEETTLNTELDRWEPWNPTVTIVLKKIRNPVPMYHKRTDWINVPVFKTPVGYDLIQGDWVTPYGKGKINDFVFTMTCRFESQTNAEARYVLTLSNPGDGIQVFVPKEQEQSCFKWPFSAPSNGYQPSLQKERSYLPEQGEQTTVVEHIRYIFRIRTGREMGVIRGPLYGKIDGDIDISRDGYIKFDYWLNPDGTPNLEENSARNLFDEVPPPARNLRQMILDRQKTGQNYQGTTGGQ